MAARPVVILPESESKVQNEELVDTGVAVSAERRSQGGMWSWGYVASSRCQGLRLGGSLSKLGSMCQETCKTTCKFLLIGYSLLATLVIIIQAICLGMMSGQTMITGSGPLEGSGKGPILNSENLNVGLVCWSGITEEINRDDSCECPDVPADLTLWGVFEVTTIATLGTLTGLVIMVLGLHFGQKILKNIHSGEERRQELKMQRMEEKLNN